MDNEETGKTSRSDRSSELNTWVAIAIIFALCLSIAVGLAIGLGIGLNKDPGIKYVYVTSTRVIKDKTTPSSSAEVTVSPKTSTTTYTTEVTAPTTTTTTSSTTASTTKVTVPTTPKVSSTTTTPASTIKVTVPTTTTVSPTTSTAETTTNITTKATIPTTTTVSPTTSTTETTTNITTIATIPTTTKVSSTTTSTTKATDICQYYQGFCFYAIEHSQPMNYNGAVENCRKKSARPADILDSVHYNMMVKYIGSFSSMSQTILWLGMVADVATKTVHFSNGTIAPYVKYKFYGLTLEPSYPKMVIEVNRPGTGESDGMWNTKPIATKHGVLCQK